MGEYQVLNSIDAIRTRPGMYIGSTENPSHLCHEVLDNAIDEIANGFANRTEIHFNHEDDSIWISDNGRGLYSYNMEMEDGSFRDSIDVLFTETHSGSKFDLEDYETLIGMNGVGLVAVNALSEWVSIRIRDRTDKNKVYIYFFKNSELISKKEEVDSDYNYSTVVGFKPDKKFFDSNEFDKRVFGERLILSKSKFINSTFILNDKEIPAVSLGDYVKSKLQLDPSTELYVLKYEKETNYNIQAYLTYSNSTVINVAGDVNLRDCTGKFISSFQTELKKIIKTKVNKKFQKLNEKEFLCGLNLYINLTIPEPKFDSQTKVRMVTDVKKTLIQPLIKQIKWFVSQREILSIIENNLNKKFQNSLIKPNGKRSKRVSVGNKLRDCIYTPGNILYIVEGDSAGGTVNIIRDKKREACFPLKGKILNVETHSLEKIKSNKEVQDLLEALGPINKRRYNNIKILCDADSDGLHISVLVLLFFQKFAPDLIQNNKISVILPPLYGATNNKNYIPIYDQKHISYYKQQGYNITRFKGLGEMNPDQLKVCLDSNMEHIVQFPKDQKTLEQIISIVTDKDVKRAIMNDNRCHYDRILNHVIDRNNQS